MCLGIPAKLTEVYTQDGLLMGKVEFGGIRKHVCLAYTPEAQLGDYLVIHAGFALTRIEPSEAEEILHCLAQLDDTSTPPQG